MERFRDWTCSSPSRAKQRYAQRLESFPSRPPDFLSACNRSLRLRQILSKTAAMSRYCVWGSNGQLPHRAPVPKAHLPEVTHGAAVRVSPPFRHLHRSLPQVPYLLWTPDCAALAPRRNNVCGPTVLLPLRRNSKAVVNCESDVPESPFLSGNDTQIADGSCLRREWSPATAYSLSQPRAINSAAVNGLSGSPRNFSILTGPLPLLTI